MVTLSAKFVMIGCGNDAKYMLNGVEIQGVVKAFIYRGTYLTLTVKDKSAVPVAELKAIGIKVKEVK